LGKKIYAAWYVSFAYAVYKIKPSSLKETVNSPETAFNIADRSIASAGYVHTHD
ncbi:hypothetical protein LPJ79_005745, partial [Coemansia sp. RSA 1821]